MKPPMVEMQSGQSGAAQPEFQRAIELWKNADADLPELHQAKQQMAELRNPALSSR